MFRKSLLTLLFAAGCLSLGAARPGFTLWQLPPQGPSQMNSYVIQTGQGHVVVIDGGTADDAPYLRGFLAALGNRVEWWFVTHPHFDHMGALTEILNNPAGIEIANVFHSPLSEDQLKSESSGRSERARAFYEALASSDVAVTELTEPGSEMRLGGVNLKVLQVNDPAITVNAYNNSSVVLRLWDKRKSFLMLGDAGIESGDRLLQNTPREELDCDYIQTAHHGQQGVSEEFYRSVGFRACLWATPLWLWNNDTGQGYDTGPFKTLDTRRWIEEKGITEHYPAWQGLVKIE